MSTRYPLKPLAQHDDFMLRFGRALAAWAGVEGGLHVWFNAITGLDPDLANAIFYSARSFNGRADMLAAVLDHTTECKEDIPLLKLLLKRASAYSGQRNAIAHGHPSYIAPDYEVSLSSGGNLLESSVTTEDLTTASANFTTLGQCILRLALNHPQVARLPSPTPEKRREECLQVYQKLPKLAFSNVIPPPPVERRTRRQT